ncbi:MAG: trypsin-like peptidase domain-containing protein [Spirochaetaceae bacterium]|nr:trypsin-like peptidase domain-containing protein [Spirochaetaceae bacterium]
MKLYSKQQVIFAAVCSALIVFLGAVGFGLIRFTGLEAKTDDTFIPEAVQSPSFVLHTSGEQNSPAKPEQLYTVDTVQGYTQDELQNIAVYEKCNEAVVNITTEIMSINWFLEPVPQEGGSGSGSIIDTRGYVLTNTHVIKDAYRIYISLSDGTQYEGKVIGSDAASDLAVVKFDPPQNMEIKTITFGDSSNLKVGQKVLAIGNPFGFERTLTTGIVSGLGRPIQTSANNIIRDMIQTDTAINPGNSGGPLLDTQGRMVGINTMIYSPSGASAGIGFSVPITTAQRVVSDLIQFGTVRRGVLEAQLVQLTPSIANYAKLSTSKGLLVSQIQNNSNAAKAGIRGGTEPVRYGSSRNSSVIYLGGDIITAINDIPVAALADYYSALESQKPGDTVTVTVLRGKQQIDLKVTLAEGNR